MSYLYAEDLVKLTVGSEVGITTGYRGHNMFRSVVTAMNKKYVTVKYDVAVGEPKERKFSMTTGKEYGERNAYDPWRLVTIETFHGHVRQNQLKQRNWNIEGRRKVIMERLEHAMKYHQHESFRSHLGDLVALEAELGDLS